jgi:hypothetical protein
MDTGSGDEIPVANTDEKTKVESHPGSEEEKVSEDADDKDEHVAEAAEDVYLSEWRKQWNASIKENNKRKQSEVSSCCCYLLSSVLSAYGFWQHSTEKQTAD